MKPRWWRVQAELDDWKNGWHGLRLSATPGEISQLITLLQDLIKDPDQHFHISSDYKAQGGLGDIEISVNTEEDTNNLFLSSLAIPP